GTARSRRSSSELSCPGRERFARCGGDTRVQNWNGAELDRRDAQVVSGFVPVPVGFVPAVSLVGPPDLRANLFAASSTFCSLSAYLPLVFLLTVSVALSTPFAIFSAFFS